MKKIIKRVKGVLKNQKGMGTVEWVVIIAVTAVLLGLAVPSIRTSISSKIDEAISNIDSVTVMN